MHLTLVAVLSSLFVATVSGTQCNITSPCPKSAPCCSEFGFCGTEEFCLGGCNPLASNTLTSCKPNPVCKSSTYNFSNMTRILTNATYFDGDIDKYDWTVDKGSIQSSGGDMAMLLTETNGGTRLSSTRYIHYGKITATMKTSKWAGVVTAFITMSNIKDEIDWEFPGTAVTEAQTNFFWQGHVPNKTAGDTSKGLSDTFSNYHDYSIDWQPEELNFLIDGKVVRTVKKSDTVDSRGVSTYPSSPSRVQLSIWPAGIPSMPQGTREWAGGDINWNDPDYKAAGQFYALVKSVTVECGDKPTDANITSYVYGPNSTTETPSVAFSNASVLLNGGISTRGVSFGGASGMVMSLAAVFMGVALFV
ncbi:glycoside hydrolase family 16 protein [Marasmius fiardii PR-910]|nr:glycoside hydrolase family 16 protein [Marasmius fiardii PR-910]